jgi:hypothetical protein
VLKRGRLLLLREGEWPRPRLGSSGGKTGLHGDAAKPTRLDPIRTLANRYSITSSARSRMDSGTVRLSALADLRLITNRNLVGCSIGRSAGLAPFEDLVDIGRGLAKLVGQTGAIGHAAPSMFSANFQMT